ncbi:MAG TPA: hypothetical protein VEI97_14460 [bacterium]|nr:hypothetical protein [bacterium]
MTTRMCSDCGIPTVHDGTTCENAPAHPGGPAEPVSTRLRREVLWAQQSVAGRQLVLAEIEGWLAGWEANIGISLPDYVDYVDLVDEWQREIAGLQGALKVLAAARLALVAHLHSLEE